MSVVDGIPGGVTAALYPISQGLARFIPEPKSRAGSGFQNILSGASNVLSAFGAEVSGLPIDMMALINQQIEIQLQMQTVSMISNLAKSEHETRMAAIRNIRVD